ncbi:uncharacterized protein N7458_000671 [Penicillium daleae]|uniref:Uncharacterized protein n=1 Tax=Penicillium daleae TaxID=63821 RepID=A0AAD6CH90_9EURO|nr:uncharacterized protein N7458_000671 [Penicillium daleae]KAJ5464985.1 hypothetical protein N7458_000671 [Penicillium daleae]
MKFTKIQRIEFLLEEIQEIVQSMKAEKGDYVPHRHTTPEAIRTSNMIPLSEASSGTYSGAQQSTGTNSQAGSSVIAEKDIRELCVRCFNTWEASIKAGQFDIPDCEWDEGRNLKKCRYCSSRRSECVKIPTSLRKGVIRRKAELHRETLDGDIEEIRRNQKRFTEIYFTTHGKVKGTLSSEERQRRRQRAALQREEQRKKDIRRHSECI